MLKSRLLPEAFICFLLALLCAGSAHAQTRTVTGKVIDNKSSPVAGATVQVKGGAGVSTNEAGEFRISVPSEADSLIFSHVEFETRAFALRNRSTFSIALQPKDLGLDAVVVVGYGTQKRRDVTGAIGSVKGDAIRNMPVTDVAGALQGRVAGVEVVKSSGEPGAPSQITIRGVASLSQPQPLYIVDGVRQDGNNINMADVASFDVLKDASAASIYGAAAAGGVIIVTTKKGLGNKPTINFNARYGVTKPRMMELLRRDEFIRLRKLIKDGVYGNQTQTDTLPDTDWAGELFGNGTEENYNLSVAGSSPNTNYFVSGIYNNQEGVFRKNSSSMYGVRLNTDIRVSDRIKIGEQFYVWQRNSNPASAFAINPPFRTIPTMAVYGNTPANKWAMSPPGFAGPNLVAQIETAHRQFTQANLQGNAYAEIKLPYYLTFKTTLGYTYYNEELNYFQEAYSAGPVSVPATNLTKNSASTRTIFTNYVLSFDHTFGKHSVNALAGYEQISGITNGVQVGATAVGGTSYAYLLTSDSRINLANGGYDDNHLIKSVFGRVSYDFDKKYFATFSVRRDGNFQKFGPNNRYGVFPAGSVGWRISDEPFMKNLLPQANLLKLRGSYGILGNSNIPSYVFLSTFDLVSAQNFAPGVVPVLNYTQQNIPNPNIKWESMYEANVGLDAEFLNGKLYASVDWYDKTTKDMLYNLPIPTSAGMPVSIFITNIGSVRNRGVEIAAGYRSNIGEFTYNIGVTGAFNKNKVLNLDNINNNAILAGDNNYGSTSFGIWTGQQLSSTKAGAPFGQFWGYKAIGMYQSDDDWKNHPQQEGKQAKAGDLIFEDYDGNGKIDEKDRQVIGSPYPDFVYGITLNLGWKGFDVQALFSGALGVDIFNGVAPYAMSPFSDGNTTSKVFGASFLGDNKLTSQPRIGDTTATGFVLDPNHNYTWANSYFVENGSYLKLKTLQIGYNLPAKILEKVKMKNARVYVMGYNLFTLTKYNGIDPELGGAVTTRGIDAPYRYPNARIYSVGLDITF